MKELEIEVSVLEEADMTILPPFEAIISFLKCYNITSQPNTMVSLAAQDHASVNTAGI